MSDLPDPLLTGNPFSTRHVRPGTIPYLFPPDASCETLLMRLEQNGWFGQIVGPHGSGKSALVATLIAALRAGSHPVELIELHDGQRALPGGLPRVADLARGTLVVVDGYEQLAAWNRLRLRRCCRRQGLGLLVTVHTAVRLPLLFSTDATVELAQRIVQCLLGRLPWPVSDAELRHAFERHQGNLRELLFDLYDAYEQRRQA